MVTGESPSPSLHRWASVSSGTLPNGLILRAVRNPDAPLLRPSYDQGVMSGLISAPQFFRVFPACDPAVQGSYKGWSIFQERRMEQSR